MGYCKYGMPDMTMGGDEEGWKIGLLGQNGQYSYIVRSIGFQISVTV